MNSFVTRKEATSILGVHYHTLYRMANDKEIETATIGKRQMYNVNKYLQSKKILNINVKRRKICYCRVSSSKQKEDLNRQMEAMTEKYPSYELITDIGSGLNMNRPGLIKIIDYAITGEIEILVIAYRDRLVRFGYELIERLIEKYSNGIIKVEYKNEEDTPINELSKDIVAIMNVYVAKMNGLRKYKKLITNDIKIHKRGNK